MVLSESLLDRKYEVVICGAGIAGIAAAYAAADAGLKKILLIDSGAPLSLTSDKSTECYRNWWPGPDGAMVSLVNRSIELMEGHARKSSNRLLLNQHGYLFATAKSEMIFQFEKDAINAQNLGAGQFRRIGSEKEYLTSPKFSFGNDLDGSDLITNRPLIFKYFPYLNPETRAILHVRRAGSLSAQQLGMYLLEEGKRRGVEFLSGTLLGVETATGRLHGVSIEIGGKAYSVRSEALILSPGPYLKHIANVTGIELPVFVEKHIKITVPDIYGILPRSAPLIIWSDPIMLPWTAAERKILEQSNETEYLIRTFPSGVHGRPIGSGNQVLMYWTYNSEISEEPVFPLEWDPYLPEITLRGMAVMVPGLKRYFDPMPKPYIDGGYYTKTADNRPLIGPLGKKGIYICSAFSGFGIMASCASGELIARYLTGQNVPAYAKFFHPTRFSNAEYMKQIQDWDTSGQL